jgi:hypothetical protein
MDGFTAFLIVVLLAGLALMAMGPIRAVRDERLFAAEERRWSESCGFPSEVHRVYRHPRMAQVDGSRLRRLGYEEEFRGMVRGAWGRHLEVIWRAVGPPAQRPGEQAGQG